MSGPELLPCPSGHKTVLVIKWPGGADWRWRGWCSCCGWHGPSEKTKAEATAAWNQREAPQGWQNMASAPMDGTEIDLWVNGRRRANCRWGVFRWHNGKPQEEPCWGPYMMGEEGPLQPTHWRPLPTPPENGNG